MFQNGRHSDTCNQIKICTKYGRPDQSQRKLTVALNRKSACILLFHRDAYGLFDASNVMAWKSE